MVKSTDAGISQRTQGYAAAKMLSHATPTMVLDKFGVTKPMPQNKGTEIKFRRPKIFTPATTPLVEGVTPAMSSFQYEDVTANLDQYGQVVEVTDVIEDTHEDPVLNDIVELLGENIGATMEALTWAELQGGTNVIYANGVARNAVNTPITKKRQQLAVRMLKDFKAKKIRKVLSGSPNYATKPIEASYIAIAHTDVESDIRALAGFTPVAQYGTMSPVCAEEIGAVDDVRYVLSPDLAAFDDAGGAAGTMKSTTGTNADVYPIIFLGKEAYGLIPLRGKESVEPSIVPVSQKDKSDPLGQRGYAGWKSWFKAVILNEAWMVRMEVAVSSLED